MPHWARYRTVNSNSANSFQSHLGGKLSPMLLISIDNYTCILLLCFRLCKKIHLVSFPFNQYLSWYVFYVVQLFGDRYIAAVRERSL